MLGRKPVFLTARFRSGSTLLWNLFRQLPEAHAYYEPLHEQLIEWLRLDISPQPRHYFVDSYFKEFRGAGRLGEFHRTEFGVYRLHLEADDAYPTLRNYLDYLVSYPSPEKVVVLKENRIDFRLPWIKSNFPQVPLIHLYRSARDQWISTIRDFPGDVEQDPDCDPYRISTWSRDLFRQFPFLAGPFIHHAYQRHYYLWKLSYLMGQECSDFSLAYEDLLQEPGKNIEQLLGFGGLDTRANIEKCRRIVVPQVLNVWKGYRDEVWFSELESDCERQLTDLGLNQNFGKQPLGQIIANNAAYQRLLRDERAVDWAVNNGQVTIIGLLNQNDERDNVIHKLQQQEQILQAFRRLPFFRIVYGLLRRFRFLLPLARRLANLRGLFMPKLGVYEQHSPRPLAIPGWYKTVHETNSAQAAPSISIVTPSYDQGKFLERTIRSVVEQAYPRLEYIVQDGGSSDETLDVLRAYQDKLTRFESRPDSGQAHAINLGFQHTSGEIMAYLNSDDILLPGALRYVADYFVRHPQVDVVYSHRVIINEKDDEVGRWLLPPHDNNIILWSDYVPQETLFWRRSLWTKVGSCIDEHYQFALDWDLILRFRAAGANFMRVPRFLAAFRTHEKQKSRAQMEERGTTEMSLLRRRIHGRDVGGEELRSNIRSYLMRSMLYYNMYRLGILRH